MISDTYSAILYTLYNIIELYLNVTEGNVHFMSQGHGYIDYWKHFAHRFKWGHRGTL